MNIATVGIDLAKNVLQVHGVDVRGKVVLRRQLRREQVAAYFVKLPPCLIGMEPCAIAHHWGRPLPPVYGGGSLTGRALSVTGQECLPNGSRSPQPVNATGLGTD